jgi:hypothetical protein
VKLNCQVIKYDYLHFETCEDKPSNPTIYFKVIREDEENETIVNDIELSIPQVQDLIQQLQETIEALELRMAVS